MVAYISLVVIFCFGVSFIALLKGGCEERILALVTALFFVIWRNKFTNSEMSQNEIHLYEIIFCLSEFVLAFYFSLKAKRLWPIIVSAIFLVKFSSFALEYFGWIVGVFSLDALKVTLQFGVAVVILWAICSGNKSRDDRLINGSGNDF